MLDLTIPDSERLTYQLMHSSDGELLWQLDQDEEVMYFINGGNKTSLEDIDEIMLPRMKAYRNPKAGWGLWKTRRMTDGAFLGWVLVRPMHYFNEQRDDSNLELGWRFHRKFWGKGYATEAAKIIMDTIAKQRGISQFSAIVDSENVASIRIMEKLGMSFEKLDVFKDPLIDEVVDYYSIKNYHL